MSTTRITDVQKIRLNGIPKKSFKLWRLDGDCFVFDGQFYAPARMPRRDFEQFANDVQLEGWEAENGCR